MSETVVIGASPLAAPVAGAACVGSNCKSAPGIGAGPVAFQRASTSGGNRRDIEAQGASLFGRPRGRNIFLAITAPYNSGSTSRAGRARRNVSAVQTGLSESTRLGFFVRFDRISAHLSPIRFPKTDDVNAVLSRRMYQDMQPRTDPSERQKTPLAVLTPFVLDDEGIMPLELGR